MEEFNNYIKTLTEEEQTLLKDFFISFDEHCLLNKHTKEKLKEDFEKAILYYHKQGTELKDALSYLDVKNLGGFYARPPVLWFPLDDAAKIYPLSMAHDRMAMFRLSVYLKEDVVPEILQMALNFTIKRFSTFATTLKKGFFWHYLDITKRRFKIEVECDVPSQPIKVSRSGSQSFRVKYYKNRISVEFFHVLTDGTGGMAFLTSLTAEYLKLLGVKIPKNDSVLDINEEPSKEEYENAFKSVPDASNASGFIDKMAVQMDGKLSKVRPCKIIHFKMDSSDLKKASKKYNATITSYLLALMFVAGKSATDKLSGDISIQVPVNMRKYYPSKTLRNFSMYCGIRLELDKITSLEDIISEITKQLDEKASKEEMSKMVTSAKRMTSMLKFVPLSIKAPIARIVYGFLGDKIFSNTLSNLGVVKLPEELSNKIESMDFILGTAITNRAGCSVVTINNITTFSISKMTVDPTFEEKFYELLENDNINVTVEGSGLYEN
ncbi:MAG: hypothetical protein Q4C33_03285 [bacterium]|nr:hypothetical protein [bacterium]